jgi:hypothetical protein
VAKSQPDLKNEARTFPHDTTAVDGRLCRAGRGSCLVPRRPQTHKRLMLLATISLLDAPIRAAAFCHCLGHDVEPLRVYGSLYRGGNPV